MDKDIIDALEQNEAYDLNLTSPSLPKDISTDQQEENSDSDDSFEFGYDLLPSDDPDDAEPYDPKSELGNDVYESRKKEAFENFDRRYEEELEKALEEVPVKRDFVIEEDEAEMIKSVMGNLKLTRNKGKDRTK